MQVLITAFRFTARTSMTKRGLNISISSHAQRGQNASASFLGGCMQDCHLPQNMCMWVEKKALLYRLVKIMLLIQILPLWKAVIKRVKFANNWILRIAAFSLLLPWKMAPLQLGQSIPFQFSLGKNGSPNTHKRNQVLQLIIADKAVELLFSSLCWKVSKHEGWNIFLLCTACIHGRRSDALEQS